MSRRFSAPRRRLVAVGLSVLALAAGALAGAPALTPAGAAPDAAATVDLITEVSDQLVTGARRGVSGEHRLVTVRTSALPQRSDGQRLAVPLGRTTGHLRVARVEHDRAYTAWTGSLEGQDLSSFSLVEVDGTLRGSLVSPAGIWSLTKASGDRYWWTEVAPWRGASGEDTLAVSPPRESLDRVARRDRRREVKARKGKSKIGVLFAYTKAAKAEAGSKAALKEAATLVVSQTNDAFANSGLKVKVKFKGLVKAKGKESPVALTNLARLSKSRDGRFDNLVKARRKNHADLVHLFTTGSQYDLCGAGNLPYSDRRTHPTIAWSTSFYSCMPYLVATHELGHNLGADHVSYPGVSHDSRLPYSYGFVNPAGNYLSVMGYYDPCEDQQIYTCVRVPWFSSTTNTYNGQPLAVDSSNDNTKVIRKVAPKVARYMR